LKTPTAARELVVLGPDKRYLHLAPEKSYTSLSATVNGRGESEVFVVGAEQVVHHLRRSAESETGWSNVLPLVPHVAQIAAGRNAEGYSVLFGAGPGSGSLIQVWQKPDTTGWAQEPVALQGLADVQSIPSFTSEITVLDRAGQPSPNQPVRIWSPDLVKLTINGATHWVDAHRPAETLTNATGKVSVVAMAETLSTPLLRLWTGHMAPDTSVVIEPNHDVQGRLRTLTETELLEAKDSSGQYLLQGDYRTEEVAKNLADGVSQAMTLVEPTVGGAMGRRRGLLRSLSSAPHAGQFSHRIDVAAVPEQHWQMSFRSGKPVFTRFSREEAATLVAEKRASLPKGLFDWVDDVGDFFEAVGEGIADVADIVVTTVEDKINAVITFVAEGVEYLLEATISLVEEVFDVVQGFFEKVAIFFKQLYEWLAMLFAWKDILRTKDALKHGVNQTFDVALAGLQFLKANSDMIFTALRSDVARTFEELIADQLGGRSFLSMEAESPGSKPVEESTANNVVLDSFVNNSRSAVGFGPGPLTRGLTDPLQTLLDNLKSEAVLFQSGDAFAKALDYFQGAISKLGSNPEQVLQQTLAGILQTLSGLAQTTLGIGQRIVGAILDAITALVAGIREA